MAEDTAAKLSAATEPSSNRQTEDSLANQKDGREYQKLSRVQTLT